MSLKQDYNKLLTTYYKATKYMDNQSIPIPEREKHLPRFAKILDGLNSLLKQIKEKGIKHTDLDLLNGFSEVADG